MGQLNEAVQIENVLDFYEIKNQKKISDLNISGDAKLMRR